jgi:hypothetical protein
MPTESDTEALIRDALEYQAQQAAEPQTVANALRRASAPKFRRSTMLVTAVASVVVVAGIGVPVGLGVVGAHNGAQPVAVQPAKAPGTILPVTKVGTPMAYRPSWLPAGLHEAQRTVEPDGQVRTWYPVGTNSDFVGNGATDQFAPQVTLSVQQPIAGYDSANGLAEIDKSPTKVTVNGVVGSLDDDSTLGGRARVVWAPNPDTIMSLTVAGFGAGSVQQLAMRIADSVGPDDSSTLQMPFQVNDVPAGLATISTLVQGTSATDWTAETDFAKGSGAGTLANSDSETQARVILSTEPQVTAGKPVTVQGQPGFYLSREPVDAESGPYSPAVWVSLDGYWLTVYGQYAQQDLVRLADSVTIQPTFDLSWLGEH